MPMARVPYARLSVLILYVVVMVLATHWPDIDRYAPAGVRGLPHVDKCVHVALYFVWTVLWIWVLSSRGRRPSWKARVALLAGGVAWAAADELTQGLAGRHPALSDFLADAVGLTIGQVAWATWSWRYWEGGTPDPRARRGPRHVE